MAEHTPTPWFHRQAGDVSRNGDHYDWIADHPGRGQHQKIIVARDSCLPEDFAFIVKAANSHEALVKALEFFADGKNWMRDAACDPNSGNFRGTNVALEALASIKETAR